MAISDHTPAPETPQEPKTNGRKVPRSPEHRAKIAAALRRYHAEHPDTHVRRQPTGPDSPRWQGGTAPKTYRRIAFDAHGKACQRCGSTRHINAHHKDENRAHNDPDNLEVLCRSCHNKAHGLGGHHGRRAA
jgi:5-methylcytosine-specific restriction endonuclease McrA